MSEVDLLNNSKLACETKLGGIIDSEYGYHKLQQVLDQMGNWAEE